MILSVEDVDAVKLDIYRRLELKKWWAERIEGITPSPTDLKWMKESVEKCMQRRPFGD